jgi:hypothetical protein
VTLNNVTIIEDFDYLVSQCPTILSSQGINPSCQVKAGGLSGGDVAGIVIAAVIAAILVAAGAFWQYRRRRGGRRSQMYVDTALQDRNARFSQPYDNIKPVTEEPPARALRYLNDSEVPSGRTNGAVPAREEA